MNDIEYRYFYEVARTLNFNQAAENLFITQPALSRCISKIEQEYGVPMFIRSKRRVQLTEAGIALLNNYPLVQKAAIISTWHCHWNFQTISIPISIIKFLKHGKPMYL